jgi:hypothetical protein
MAENSKIKPDDLAETKRIMERLLKAPSCRYFPTVGHAARLRRVFASITTLSSGSSLRTIASAPASLATLN